ncbi:hypothetical protein V6N13_103876 [Hibiscus sabdariffa]|uniref:Uncharacterized protein n=2 Tax=Hibiscus sabdariffa TaxID=183260 RepID=A0ABR2BT27_9ROSI
MERFIAADAARERMFLRLRETANMAANIFAEYQKAQAENKKLKGSLSEVQEEIAKVKALLDLKIETSDAALETHQKIETEDAALETEIDKFMALFKA